jgi:hypothetical protein
METDDSFFKTPSAFQRTSSKKNSSFAPTEIDLGLHLLSCLPSSAKASDIISKVMKDDENFGELWNQISTQHSSFEYTESKHADFEKGKLVGLPTSLLEQYDGNSVLPVIF